MRNEAWFSADLAEAAPRTWRKLARGTGLGLSAARREESESISAGGNKTNTRNTNNKRM